MPAGLLLPAGQHGPGSMPPGLSLAAGLASAICTQSLAASALRDYDWLVAASWLAVTTIGVACKRFWILARRGQEKFTRNT